jgi:serine/threonine protein kinase/Tfp pilus assembly protein PilF
MSRRRQTPHALLHRRKLPLVDPIHNDALLSLGYEPLALLGSGGMGRVWRARERSLERDVAIKLLATTELRDRQRERFLLEARALARIQHPNVVVVYRLGEVLGVPFLAYELIDGVSVDQLIGSLRWPRALAIAIDLVRGLAAAHQVGVLHRDLKPANAMVTAEGTAKLIDFGLAKLLRDDDGEDSELLSPEASEQTTPMVGSVLADKTYSSDDTASRVLITKDGELTRRGALLGTPRYIAPELWHGARASPQTDVYTLGLIAWEMLTGSLAHAPVGLDGESGEGLRTRVETPLRSVATLQPEAPRELAAIVDKAVCKRPSERFHSALELQHALESFADDMRAEGRIRARRELPSPSEHDSESSRPFTAVVRSEHTVAVLPFESAGDEELGYVSEGLAEELIDGLSDTPGLKVRPRASTAAFAGREDHSTIARELGVQILVEGSVRRIGDRVRIRVRLISGVDGFQLSAKRFDCTLGELFAVSDTIVETVVSALKERLTSDRSLQDNTLERSLSDTGSGSGSGERQHATEPGWDPAGVDMYLQARHELRRNWHTDVSRAIELFEQALVRLPGSPRVLAGAAVAYARLAFVGGQDGAARALGAIEFAERAIAIDPTRSEPHYARAMYHFNSGAPRAALVSLARARELAPTNAEVHDLLGRVLLELDDLPRALEHLELAHRLNPQEANTRFDLIRAHAMAGKWDQADALLQREGLTLGEFDAAVLTLTAARIDLWREHPRWLPADDSDLGEHLVGEITGILRAASRSRSLDPRLITRLRELAEASPPRRRILMHQFLTEVAAHAGAMNIALDSATQAVEVGLCDLTWLVRCPLLTPLNQHPRMLALRERILSRVGG